MRPPAAASDALRRLLSVLQLRLPLRPPAGRRRAALCAVTTGTLCLVFLAGPSRSLARSGASGGADRSAGAAYRVDEPHAAPTSSSASVRVRLLRLSRPRTLTLVASEATALRGGSGGTVRARLRAGDEVVLSVRGGRVVVARGTDTWDADEVALDAGDFTLALPSGGRDARRRYSGTLVVRDDPAAPGTLRLIHTVDMETYVAAVVQREYGLGDLEGAKAMAVAARTYALRSRGRFGREYDLVDDVQSQVFFGLQGVSDLSREAARQTRGEVLTYRGQLAEAVYSSSSGGYTAANETIWGTAAVPYLRARPDPYDTAASPLARWTKRVPRAALLDALSARLSEPVVGFFLAGVGACGRPTAVEAILSNGRRNRISTARFRSIVNNAFDGTTLRSARFTARADGDAYVFDGGGFGHGVGMSQWGAHGQALAGHSYRDILAFYYEGTQLRGADGLHVPLTPLPSAVRPDEDEAALLDRAFAHLGGSPAPTPAAGTPGAAPTTASTPRRDTPRGTTPPRPAADAPPTPTPNAPTASATADPAAHPQSSAAAGWSGPAATRPPTRRTGW